MSILAYIALGSNLGDRQEYLDRALAGLQEKPGIVVTQVSSFCETAPVGGPAVQGPYLNASAEIETTLSPHELLQVLLDVERGLGRVREAPCGPRTIDLDLLLYGDRTFDEPCLIIPHPRMHERRFVLEPLAEIAPRALHPKLGKSVADLLDSLPETPPLDPAPVIPEGEPLPMLPRAAPGRELAGLHALVTGSTSGIGRAIALELAAGGADVIIHGRRPNVAEELASQVRDRDVQARVVLADLADADGCRNLVKEAWNGWGGLDIWINNAGADTLTGEALHWSFERKLHQLLTIDVTATMLLARTIGERMKSAGRGVILNMGWDQAESGMEGDSGQLFAASKGAVMAFTRSLAVTLAPEVRVNCLAPGWIRTAWGEAASPRWHERVLRETPLARWGVPEDVAATARWLVSPAAAFLTGQIIRINGGAVR